MMQPDYTDIQQLLAQEHSLADAAEAHGTLAGCLCGASGYRFEDWLKEILPEGRATGAATRAAARTVRLRPWRRSSSRTWNSNPQLPDDEAPLEERTAALAQWCQGFLYGLGAGSITDASELPGEVGEIVRDFIEISRAAVDAESGEESNENAYAELVEFVRVGVQLLFEELASARRPGAPRRDAAALKSARERAIMARDEFARRRRQLMRLMGRDSIAVLPAAPVRHRNSDVEYPYRQDSDFQYLTGFGEPEAVAVLVPGRAQAEYILFLRERDPQRETWDGQRAGPAGARRDYGADDAFPITRHGRDPARPAREPRARVLHHGRLRGL